MKEIIKQLNYVKQVLNDECFSDDASDSMIMLEEIITELQNPTPLSPQQFFEQEGRELSPYAAVYFKHSGYGYRDEPYAIGAWDTVRKFNQLEYYVVCAKNLDRPPPADWRPEC